MQEAGACHREGRLGGIRPLSSVEWLWIGFGSGLNLLTDTSSFSPQDQKKRPLSVEPRTAHPIHCWSQALAKIQVWISTNTQCLPLAASAISFPQPRNYFKNNDGHATQWLAHFSTTRQCLTYKTQLTHTHTRTVTIPTYPSPPPPNKEGDNCSLPIQQYLDPWLNQRLLVIKHCVLWRYPECRTALCLSAAYTHQPHLHLARCRPLLFSFSAFQGAAGGTIGSNAF